MNSVIVKVCPPEDSPAVDRYIVFVVNGTADQSCVIFARTPGLSCEIKGLEPGKKYDVDGRACIGGLADAHCSNPVIESIRTPIDGKCYI